MAERWCPRGHGALVHSEVNGAHDTCDACHGFSVTVWLLDEMLVEGAGGEMWRESAVTPATGDPCPACRHPMRRVEVPGPPGGGRSEVEVCRDCELVWVEAAAVARLPVLPELAGTGLGAPGPTHCPNCGAVYDTTGGRCRYCRAEVPTVHVDVVGPILAELETRRDLAGRQSSGLVERYIDVTRHEPRSW